ncbi:ANTAR domain-containing protein [Prauserella endophytica]|uniref:ANTAR domain-containing protein n=1 Tax=Prauserella endophytica TaxID=1592324 RepID=A0ABY2RWF5_9PSEU|nr:ANTAR domain-containing protein [Prauserella endophytica]TKG63136.1 ANTAR domain-containing protein [Prauserella endophytica]
MGHTPDNHGSGSPDDADLLAPVAHLENELDGLRRALRTRATIEQAMGVLVVSHRCTPQEAFQVLVRLSQQYNIKLHRIAQALVQLAQRVEQAQLEPLLHEAAAGGSIPLDGDGPGPSARGDEAVLDLMRTLAEAYSDEENDKALTALYQALVEHGWVPPYDVLSRLRVRA